MASLRILLATGLWGMASGQFIAGSGDSSGNPSLLCNKTFADANATGIFSFNPNVAQGDQTDQPENDSNMAMDAQWGVTVWNNIYAPNSTIEYSAWYNTNGANYSDDANLWYDVCVVTLNTLKLNTNYRAVNDNGDCTEALDVDCINALKSSAAGFAYELVTNATPNPGSNLTQGSITHVCYDVGNLLQDNFPKECNKYFNGSAAAYGAAMTSHNDSWLYDGCSLTNEADDSTFHFATGQSIFTSTYSEEMQKAVYDAFTYIVIPALTVFLPIADVEAETTIGTALAALWFFWSRKRRARKADKLDEGETPPAYTADAKVAEAPYDNEQVQLSELNTQESQVRPELPTQKSGGRVELAGDLRHHDAQTAPPAELPAAEK